MEVVSNIITVHLPNYLTHLPIPKSILGFAKLSGMYQSFCKVKSHVTGKNIYKTHYKSRYQLTLKVSLRTVRFT